MLAVASVLLLGGGTVVGVQALNASSPPPAPLPTRTFENADPTAAPAPATAQSSAPDLGPNQLAIASLGILAPLQEESITANELGLPSNDQVVGIWSAGAQVGSPAGTILLAGHVSYPDQGPGALASLVNITPGAEILVTSPTGHVSRWSTTSLQVVLRKDLPQGIFSATGPRRLVIVTCGGPFDKATRHYASNVIVTATPLDH